MLGRLSRRSRSTTCPSRSEELLDNDELDDELVRASVELEELLLCDDADDVELLLLDGEDSELELEDEVKLATVLDELLEVDRASVLEDELD